MTASWGEGAFRACFCVILSPTGPPLGQMLGKWGLPPSSLEPPGAPLVWRPGFGAHSILPAISPAAACEGLSGSGLEALGLQAAGPGKPVWAWNRTGELPLNILPPRNLPPIPPPNSPAAARPLGPGVTSQRQSTLPIWDLGPVLRATQDVGFWDPTLIPPPFPLHCGVDRADSGFCQLWAFFSQLIFRYFKD